MSSLQPAHVGIRTRLFQIIFESDTPIAKGFDILLALLIFMSVGVILLDSVQEYHERFGTLFYYTEWCDHLTVHHPDVGDYFFHLSLLDRTP